MLILTLLRVFKTLLHEAYMNEKQTKGFIYRNEIEAQAEFNRAIRYFKQHRQEVKLSRKKRVGISKLKHSYLNWNPANAVWDDKKIIAMCHGKHAEGKIGEGGGSRVKYGMNIRGDLFAVKIRESFHAPGTLIIPNKEPELCLDIDYQLIQSDELSYLKQPDPRIRDEAQLIEKHYMALKHLGKSLDKEVEQSSFNFKQKVDIARKIAWDLHLLHTGKKTPDGSRYAHGDIKLGNIAIDLNNHIALFDFDSAQLLDTPVIKPTKTATELYDPTNALSSESGLIWMSEQPTLENLQTYSQSLFIRTPDAIHQFNKWENTLITKKIVTENELRLFNSHFPTNEPIEQLTLSQLKILINITQASFQSLHQDVLNKKSLLGPVGSDLFALKRALFYPDGNKSCAGLFSTEEQTRLNHVVQDRLESRYISDQALTVIKNESALDMVYDFILQKLTLIQQENQADSTALFQFSADIADKKELICDLFYLLDNIEEKSYIDPDLKHSVINQYTFRIMDSSDESSLYEIKNELELVSQCLLLLEEIRQCKIGQSDRLMDSFINLQIETLMLCQATSHRETLKLTLEQTLRSLQSKEIEAINTQIISLSQGKSRPLVTKCFGRLYQDQKTKAHEIQHALQKVPLMERQTAFTGAHEQANKVRWSCAKNRYGLYRPTNSDREIDARYAAKTFKKLKRELTDKPIQIGLEMTNKL